MRENHRLLDSFVCRKNQNISEQCEMNKTFKYDNHLQRTHTQTGSDAKEKKITCDKINK